MASNITRKRKRSAASESAASSLVSQESSVSADFDKLNFDIQDSGSESTFKKPRMKATGKLQHTCGSFLPDCFELRMEIEGCMFPKQKVRPVTDNYVIDLVAMIKTLSEVATCKKCKEGEIEIFEIDLRGTSASKLLFRCNACDNAKISMNVGVVGSKSTNVLDSSCVLGARLAGINSEKLRVYHASLGLPPPPSSYSYPRIEKQLLVAVENEAKASMARAAKELQTRIGIDISTRCAHVSASIDGAYHHSSCFSSIISPLTNKVLAYEVISNRCATCTYYKNKDKKFTLSDDLRLNWDAHKIACPALRYQDYADVHLESVAAVELIQQAHERGIVCNTLICDGDNDTVGSVNKSDTYLRLGMDLKVSKILCLSHVMRNMMKLLYQKQPISTVQACSRSVGEITHLTHVVCGNVAHFYRLALEHHDGDPIGTKAEVDAVPFHLGNDHKFCPNWEKSWCEHYRKCGSPDPPKHLGYYISEELVHYISRIFTEYNYNDVNFLQTLSFGKTSNLNESLHGVLRELVPKAGRAGFFSLCLGAALAVIRYNDGYKGLVSIFESFSGDKSFIRMKEDFTKRDNKRIKYSISKEDTMWEDTYAEELVRDAEHRRKVELYGLGYSHDLYSGTRLFGDMNVPVDLEDSDDTN